MATKRTKAPEPEPEEGTVWIQVALPVDVHRALKVRAAMDDMSLKDSVIAAVIAYVS